jgi:tetratricopeptide (TPR) repeat protein
VNAKDIFDRAYRSFKSGDLQAARSDLLILLKVEKNNVAVLHLLALAEKGLGDYDPARQCFELAMQLAPQDAELAANAANLFAACGDIDAALSAYSRAIALAPSRLDFRLNRAIVLLDAGRAEQALGDAEYLRSQPKTDARILTVAGQIYRSAKNFDAAQTAFRRALELEPERATALLGLGELLLEEGDPETLVPLQKLHLILPNDLGITLSVAEALEAKGQFDEAIALLDAYTEMSPEWNAGHLALARMRGEAGGQHDVSSGYERALIAMPESPDLWAHYAAFLRSNDSPAAALAVLQRAKRHVRFDPTLALIEAGISDDMGDTERSAALLKKIPIDHYGATAVRMRHLIRSGKPDEASAVGERALTEKPDDIGLWALISLGWRMVDDPRESWLNPAAALFTTMDIGLPGDANELVETLRQMHVARRHPPGQSLRNGTQTRGSLFRRRDACIMELGQHILSAVHRYFSLLPPTDATHPLLRHRNQPQDFAGSWSVRLTQGGFHVSHIHPAGIVSSAFYVSLPETLGGENKDGWLAIGDAPPELATGLEPYALVEPKAGRLALFPSYLFHGTRPFQAGERLTVAFDIAPT